MGGWRCLRLKTLRPRAPRVPVEDTLQEVPEEGRQEEEDAVDDAPSVGAVAMAKEVWGVLEGVVATPAASSTPPFGCSQIQGPAQRRQGLCRPGRRQAKGRAQRARLN
jgi:hypothetical protein